MLFSINKYIWLLQYKKIIFIWALYFIKVLWKYIYLQQISFLNKAIGFVLFKAVLSSLDKAF